jgi:hypothetical protein
MCAGIALACAVVGYGVSSGIERAADVVPLQPVAAHASLSAAPDQYLGIYTSGVPASSARVTAFERLTNANVNIAMYFSSWNEPFQISFALGLRRQNITPLVQINPTKVSLSAIAKGEDDQYLVAYASAVRVYGHPVIIGFGHEMNGDWYPWAYRHTSPAVFVAAWRHIVNVFRSTGADNVTWLWTVNAVANGSAQIADPDAWWPGANYVTWVGIDGYYFSSSQTFFALFASTILDVRKVTSDPIIIAETGAASQAGKAAKIADLFAGVKASGMLGLVWFDAVGNQDWRIDNDQGAIVAFQQGADASGEH